MQLVLNLLLLSVFCRTLQVSAQRVNIKAIKCGVCKAVVQEMKGEIARISEKRTVTLSGYSLDYEGNTVNKIVQYRKSENYISELMENICDKMREYCKIRYQKTGTIAVLKFLVKGKQNPLIFGSNFIPDSDLYKSLDHICVEVLEDHEESFMKVFTSENPPDDMEGQICSNMAGYCYSENESKQEL